MPRDPRSKDDRPAGAGQRVVEQPRKGSTANRVGRAGNRPGVLGKPAPRVGPSSNARAQVNADRELKDEQAAVASEQEQENARKAESGELAGTGDQDVIGPDELSDEQKAARRAELAGVDPELRDKDTSHYPTNESTPSQQPTMLESKGGTEQPHPTMAPRPAKSAMQGGAPGRSHDRNLAIRKILREGGTESKGDTLRVRATQQGIYDSGQGPVRYREGDVFTLVPRTGLITEWALDGNGDQIYDRNDFPVTKQVMGTLSAEEQFSERWMETVNADEAERVTTAKQALKQKHDQLLGERAGYQNRGAAGRSNDQNVVE